jgi:hypothetical protein
LLQIVKEKLDRKFGSITRTIYTYYGEMMEGWENQEFVVELVIKLII